ncbi:hypothetical protein RHMOL_Rhmol06G0156000 [Rhododendron molle]|uniref:Uncharacterized protein n=1 Tax=Rhododendron molle TaxID=49168 RepID=A0ACC0NF02_RHOML|nr:hypothetical protein RHMOL_Rhmol06G0156000 [Rhododendron molle]
MRHRGCPLDTVMCEAFRSNNAIANGDPSAGAHHQSDELISLQRGIPQREHQCVTKKDYRRESVRVNG